MRKIVISVLLIVFILPLTVLCSAQSKDEADDMRLINKVDEGLTTGKWKSHSIGNTGITILSPVPLNKIDVPMSENVKSKILDMKIYSYSRQLNDFAVTITFVNYINSIHPNLDNAVSGSMNGLKNLSGISTFTYNQKPIVINGMDGADVIANWYESSREWTSKAIFVVSGSKLWSVSIMYPSMREGFENIANRMLKSLTIKNLNR